MVFAVDIQADERVVHFPEVMPTSERQAFRDYTATSLRCIVPDCRAPLVANFREAKRNGFSHHDGTGNHAPISLWHEQGQHLIQQWATRRYPTLHVAIERASADRRRRPDITVTGETGAVAVEVQYASIGVASWRQRHADLDGQYLAQTWLLGHHGEHFKVTKDGTLRFSDLIRAMTAAGTIPLWLNPETAEVLTAWSQPDQHGPTPPRSDTAHGYDVVPLRECTLTVNGLRTPALEAMAEAAARRAEGARQRAAEELRVRERQRERWRDSAERAWVLDRHDGTLPGFITDRLIGDALVAEKVNLAPEHWKALVYHHIVADEQNEWVTYKSILAALTRRKHRGLGNTHFNTINAYLRRLRDVGAITLRKNGRLHILAARTAHPPGAATGEAADDPRLACEGQVTRPGDILDTDSRTAITGAGDPPHHSEAAFGQHDGSMEGVSMTDPQTLPDQVARRDAAERWVAVCDALRSVTGEPPPEPTWTRLIARATGKKAARQRQQRRHELLHQAHLAANLMELHCVGAHSGKWGVLSGGDLGDTWAHRTMTLENTLGGLRSLGGPIGDIAADLLNVLPAARADTELSQDEDSVADIEQGLLRLLVDHDLDPRQRRALIEHLPGERRPLADSLASLERNHPPVTMFVSHQGTEHDWGQRAQEPYIRLHDIVITPGLRGTGLGTAAMTELCRYADHHGYPIEGDLEPGPGYPDHTIEPLARWYAGLGFHQGDRELATWVRRGRIRREPGA